MHPPINQSGTREVEYLTLNYSTGVPPLADNRRRGINYDTDSEGRIDFPVTDASFDWRNHAIYFFSVICPDGNV